MNQSSIIVYRNPVEQWWWESGWGPEFVTWGALLLMGAIVLGAAVCYIDDWKRKRRWRK